MSHILIALFSTDWTFLTLQLPHHLTLIEIIKITKYVKSSIKKSRSCKSLLPCALGWASVRCLLSVWLLSRVAVLTASSPLHSLPWFQAPVSLKTRYFPPSSATASVQDDLTIADLKTRKINRHFSLSVSPSSSSHPPSPSYCFCHSTSCLMKNIFVPPFHTMEASSTQHDQPDWCQM